MTLRASKIMQERAMANEKIEFVWNTEVIDVIGDKEVDEVSRLKIELQGRLLILAVKSTLCCDWA